MCSSKEERVLVMGATNRPENLDDAALRRLQHRIHVEVPDKEARVELFKKLFVGVATERDLAARSASLTEGYSASDVAAVAKDAAYGPIREQMLNNACFRILILVS